MREFKYRVFVKRTHNYVPMGMYGTRFIETKRDSKTKIHLTIYKGQIVRSQGFSIDDVDVMAFTGKRDKNGIEIYEGDYLVDRFPINDEDLNEGYNESLLPVMWCDNKHCWCVDVTFAKNDKKLEPIHSYFGEFLEVKGNIHEQS